MFYAISASFAPMVRPKSSVEKGCAGPSAILPASLLIPDFIFHFILSFCKIFQIHALIKSWSDYHLFLSVLQKIRI